MAFRKSRSLQKTLLLSAVRIERGLPISIQDGERDGYLLNSQYQTRDSLLRYFQDVWVSPSSVIYEHLVVDPESLYLRRNHRYYQTRHLAKKLLFAEKVSLDKANNYLLATDQESTGHFHWLTEVLPRLWLVRERANEFILLLPNNPYVRSIGLQSLELLGFAFAGIEWMHDDQVFTVPNLVHISSVALSGQMHDGIMQELSKAFVGEGKGGSRKIYVSRSNAWRRKVLNDDELITMLLANGFEVFTGEGMNLKQQIDLFSQCETLVSIHGAGLANCLFMHPGNVLEIKKKEPIYAYWHLAGSLGHKYYYYNGIPDSDQSLVGTGCNLTVPVSDFERLISRIL